MTWFLVRFKSLDLFNLAQTVSKFWGLSLIALVSESTKSVLLGSISALRPRPVDIEKPFVPLVIQLSSNHG